MPLKRVTILLASLAVISSAYGQTFGNWMIVDADDGSGDVVAATGTEGSREVLGYRCFVSDGNCRYVLLARTKCENGGRYPMLLNAQAGSALVVGNCHKTTTSDQFLLQPWEPIQDALQNGAGLIGFAIPMESGAFRAIRFNVRGGAAAILEAERRVLERRSGRGAPSRATSTTF